MLYIVAAINSKSSDQLYIYNSVCYLSNCLRFSYCH